MVSNQHMTSLNNIEFMTMVVWPLHKTTQIMKSWRNDSINLYESAYDFAINVKKTFYNFKIIIQPFTLNVMKSWRNKQREKGKSISENRNLSNRLWIISNLKVITLDQKQSHKLSLTLQPTFLPTFFWCQHIYGQQKVGNKCFVANKNNPHIFEGS